MRLIKKLLFLAAALVLAMPLPCLGQNEAAADPATPFAILELMDTDLQRLGDDLQLDTDQLGALKYMLAVDTAHLERELRLRADDDTQALLALYQKHRETQLAFESELKRPAPDFAALGKQLRAAYRGKNPASFAALIETKTAFFSGLRPDQQKALAAIIAAKNP